MMDPSHDSHPTGWPLVRGAHHTCVDVTRDVTRDINTGINIPFSAQSQSGDDSDSVAALAAESAGTSTEGGLGLGASGGTVAALAAVPAGGSLTTNSGVDLVDEGEEIVRILSPSLDNDRAGSRSISHDLCS